jgi:hypothetical protein
LTGARNPIRICPMAKAQQAAITLIALVVLSSSWLARFAPAWAESATPVPSPTPSGAGDDSFRLIVILGGSLVLATAILAGVIIYMLKMFKHKY